VTVRLADLGTRAVILDIEGTTTPIAFVHDVLFPYARARLTAYLTTHWDDEPTRDVRRRFAGEHEADRAAGHAPPAWENLDSATPLEAAAYAAWLMDRDRKSPGLKRLQGLVWEAGYRDGVLHGEVYPDVPLAIARWCAAGVAVAIYSSGSEQAQRLLFESVESGSLAPHLAGFFDTAVGAKVEAASYARIAGTLGVEPAELLFVSDVVRELLAAREAGVAGLLSIRPGNPTQPDAGFRAIRSFDEIV
jgi:enolase-phosphatase E1